MFNYKNEAAFSKAVCAHLRKQGYFVQRIETGSTGRGVPDIYAVSISGKAMWLELKRVHTNAAGKRYVTIPWRPGQQAWLHLIVTSYKQTAYTLAAFNDCILLIQHAGRIYKNDIVLLSQCTILNSISAL